MLQYGPRTIVALFFLSWVGSNPLSAADLLNAKKGQVAVKGYDVVAYFTEGQPVRGTAEHEYVWRDVRWQFSSHDNLEAFASAPARYAPRYGGYCAGGMALGRRAPIDPEAFVIVDGKLYLNYDKKTAVEFEATAEDSISKADANWQQMNTN
jgi:hypothetical protein